MKVDQKYPRLRAAMGAALLCAGLGLAPAEAPASQPHDTLNTLNTLDMSAYKGRVVYLDFWASWCAPCKMSFAYMNQLRASYPDKDLAIVTVNLDHNRAAAAGVLGAVGGHLPVTDDAQGALAGRYGVATMPTTVLFDRNGKQRFVHKGYFPNKQGEYGAHVAALVAEHP